MRALILIFFVFLNVSGFAQSTQWGDFKVNGGNVIGTQNILNGYSATVTAAATTTLTNTSTGQQYFTGATTQTCKLPVVSTLALGQQYLIVNNSTGAVTVQSSGGNSLQAMLANTQLLATVVSLSGTGTASWSWTYSPQSIAALPTSNFWVGNGSGVATPVLMSGDATMSSGGSVALAAIGTAGAYYKVNTDSKGRVTSGNTSLVVGDLPALAAANIWVGNGSGAAAAVSTSGDVTVNSSGAFSLKTMSPGVGGTSYLAVVTDANGRVTSGNNTLSTSNFWVGNSSNVATAVAMSNDATMSAGGSLILKTMSPGVGGTSYLAVVTDANGRVTSGNNTLAATDFWLGNGSNVATAVAMSGDATMTNAGVMSLKTMSPGVGGVTYGAVTTDANGRVTSGAAVAGFANGGTSNSSYTDGQLLIGNSSGGGLTKATITAGSNITVTNGNGSISIAASSSATPAFTYVSQTSTLNPAVLGSYYLLSGSSFTITLPDATAAGSAGKIIALQHNGTSFSQLYTLNTTSAQTINGPNGAVASGNYILVTVGETLWLFDDGANWQVFSHKTRTGWITDSTVSLSATSAYVFTVTSANATAGAIYSNNGQTYTVSTTIAAGVTLTCSGTGTPAASGTLTKVSGTGDSTITFSSKTITGQPIVGTGTVVNNVVWMRDGNMIYGWYMLSFTTGGTAGSGDYVVGTPAGQTVDTTGGQPLVAQLGTASIGTTVGLTTSIFRCTGFAQVGAGTAVATNVHGGVLRSPTTFRLAVQINNSTTSIWGSAALAVSNANSGYNFICEFPMANLQP